MMRRRALRWGMALILLLCVAFLFTHEPEYTTLAHKRINAKVTWVYDGDTIQAQTATREIRVRLIGVDTPESVDPDKPVEPGALEASAFTKKRLLNRNVVLEYDTETHDRYGRELCYVWLGEELFNETLVREGYAKLLTFPPNTKYLSVFKRAEKRAA